MKDEPRAKAVRTGQGDPADQLFEMRERIRRKDRLIGDLRDRLQVIKTRNARLDEKARQADGQPRPPADDALDFFSRSMIENAARLLAAHERAGSPGYDLVIAHELRLSGYAGLRLASLSDARMTMLDSVEHLRMSEKSSIRLRERATADPLGTSLLENMLVDIAGRYDRVFTTSPGQSATLRQAGIARDVGELLNCRTDVADRPSDDLRSAVDARDGDVVIVYNNNAYEGAGLPECIRALGHLPDHVKLVVLGNVYADIEDALDQLDGSAWRDRFATVDPVPQSRLLDVLAGADVAIIPFDGANANLRTSLPNRVFENIAAGNSMVAVSGTETGTFVGSNVVGTLSPSLDPRDLAEAIGKELAIVGAGGRADALADARSRFTWEREFEKVRSAMDGRGLKRVAYVACKDISRNDRIRRSLASLRNDGMEVTLYSYSPSDAQILSGIDGLRRLQLLRGE
ncbi:glycosyltransferase [Jannaschia sp. Os4]|uniref:glycosyltransferase n=1 Tax=Jannaschia sp. Os4 TaxID=2807617 RepID=UPI0019394469|nr:glycosyltransferase [Jannaschia sp. Os4]MBM2576300.1 glycosyltransferase [Jannaschia sp. Os4]